MLAMVRAVMLSTSVILLDERPTGLATKLVEEAFRINQKLKGQQVIILLVEQFAAPDVSNYAYVLESGTIAVSGPASHLKGDPAVRAAYLGGAH